MKYMGWFIAVIFTFINTAMSVRQDKLIRKADILETQLISCREWNNAFLEMFTKPKEDQWQVN